MARTSDKGEKILAFIQEFTRDNGYAPSVREIGAAVGLNSTASVSPTLPPVTSSAPWFCTTAKETS